MLIELTEKFADDKTLQKFFSLCKEEYGGSSVVDWKAFMLDWCKLAKLALQSGTPMVRKPVWNNVSRIVEIPDEVFQTVGYTYMEEVGLIRPAENETPISGLDIDHFEQWWKAYPFRLVAGRKVKVGRKTALNRFNSYIRDSYTFEQLMKATTNYSQLCNGLPKDPERFLKNDLWKDYINVGASQPTTTVTAVGADTLRKMLAN